VLACAVACRARVGRTGDLVVARGDAATGGIDTIAAVAVGSDGTGLPERQLVAAAIVDSAARFSDNAIRVRRTGRKAGHLRLTVANIRRTRLRRARRRTVSCAITAVTGAIAIGGRRKRAAGAGATGVATACARGPGATRAIAVTRSIV
jgi:hypothetical protein